MPSAKSGKAGTLVKPAKPDEAKDADDDKTGKVTDTKADPQSTSKGQVDSVKVPPYKPPENQSEEEKQEKPDWIEVKLTDDDGKPIAGEPFYADLADGTRYNGTTDSNGVAHIDGLKPGSCQIHFPDLEDDQWKKQ